MLINYPEFPEIGLKTRSWLFSATKFDQRRVFNSLLKLTNIDNFYELKTL